MACYVLCSHTADRNTFLLYSFGILLCKCKSRFYIAVQTISIRYFPKFSHLFVPTLNASKPQVFFPPSCGTALLKAIALSAA